MCCVSTSLGVIATFELGSPNGPHDVAQTTQYPESENLFDYGST